MPSNEPCVCKNCLQFRKEQDRRDRARAWRWRVASALRLGATNRLRVRGL